MIVERKVSRFTATYLTLAFSILATVLPCHGTEAWQKVFDPFAVLTLHLEMDSNDWDRVRFDQPSQSEDWVAQVPEALRVATR